MMSGSIIVVQVVATESIGQIISDKRWTDSKVTLSSPSDLRTSWVIKGGFCAYATPVKQTF